MLRLPALEGAQLKLMIKRNEKWCTALHNEDCSAERRTVIMRNICSAQAQIEKIAQQHNLLVSYPGIDPLFTDISTGESFPAVTCIE